MHGQQTPKEKSPKLSNEMGAVKKVAAGKVDSGGKK